MKEWEVLQRILFEYMDNLSNRVEAFADTNEAQYMDLKQAVHKAWGRKSL